MGRINAGPEKLGNWNGGNLNLSPSNNWRASLVPAAAVIPAPRAYTKVVAVKTLVVEIGHRAWKACSYEQVVWALARFPQKLALLLTEWGRRWGLLL